MANKYAQSSGNWSAGGGGGIWYDAASGGSEVAKPAAGDVAYIVDGAAVAIDEDVSCAQITATGNTGYITVAANRTMTLTGNPGLRYSGTSTSGFVRVSSGVLTITHDQGAGTVAVQGDTSNGRPIVTSSTGGLSVSNIGGTAFAAGGGRIEANGTGDVSFVGDIVHTSSNNIYRIAGACTMTITGDITSTGLATGGFVVNAGAVLKILGNINYDSTGVGVVNVAQSIVGSVEWTGARTISAGKYVMFSTGSSHVLKFATATAALSLTCHGALIVNAEATGNLTVTDAGGTANVELQDQFSGACMAGLTDKTCITIKNLTAGNVKKDEVIHGVTGTYEGAGGGGGRAVIIGG